MRIGRRIDSKWEREEREIQDETQGSEMRPQDFSFYRRYFVVAKSTIPRGEKVQVTRQQAV